MRGAAVVGGVMIALVVVVVVIVLVVVVIVAAPAFQIGKCRRVTSSGPAGKSDALLAGGRDGTREALLVGGRDFHNFGRGRINVVIGAVEIPEARAVAGRSCTGGGGVVASSRGLEVSTTTSIRPATISSSAAVGLDIHVTFINSRG